MKTYQIFLIITVMMAVLVVLTAAALQPDGMNTVISWIVLFLFYVGPLLAGEELYDLIDKQLDRHLQPEKKLGLMWHLVFAILVGLIFLVLWPAVSVMILDLEALKVGQWIRYAQPVPTEPGLLGYPAYAVTYGLIASLSSMIGYLLEPAFYLWKRRKN